MPKLMGNDDNNAHVSASNFKFSAIGIDKLDSDSYTIVQILVDESGSVDSFKSEIENAIKTVADACKKNPNVDKLLIRVATFGSQYSDSINELHGFLPMSGIDSSKYVGAVNPSGCTPLYDAAMDSVDTVRAFGKQLVAQEFTVNAIVFVITDGAENASHKAKASDVKKSIHQVKLDEEMDSIRTILVGINDSGMGNYLNDVKNDCGFDEYIAVGDATPGKLAKLAQWVSNSISSTSQALGTGGPSKPVSLTF